MNTAQIKRVAMAAAIFAGAGAAFAGPYSGLHVVFCKATILGEEEGENSISVTLPPTEGYYDNDGTPLTYWNVGNVPSGGVADSWHAEGGPGRFTAKNAGTRGAYFYVATAGHNYWFDILRTPDNYHGMPSISDDVWDTRTGIFGNYPILMKPAISPKELRRWYGDGREYHLAFTTDVTAKVPTWHSLDHRWDGGSFSTEEQESLEEGEVFGFMGYVYAGDYLTFDLKFWAPWSGDTQPSPVLFTFCVEASAFPLWDHGLAVE